MGASPPPSLLIAVDSNVPLELADGNEAVLDALATIRQRLPHARFVITPSVFQELAHVALRDPLPDRQELGVRALRELNAQDVGVPVIASPREIVNKFFR